MDDTASGIVLVVGACLGLAVCIGWTLRTRENGRTNLQPIVCIIDHGLQVDRSSVPEEDPSGTHPEPPGHVHRFDPHN